MSILENQSLPRLSIVIPAYNEEERISQTVHSIAEYLASQSYSYELVISDDGSTDATSAMCAELGREYPWISTLASSRNFGKGHAVRLGVLEAKGEYILVSDADLATPIEELDGFWGDIEGGADIVIASRPLRGSHLLTRQPLYREIAGRTLNLLIRMLAVRGIHDTQCGFKLFRADAARGIFPLCTLNGFGFDIEVLHIAQRLGLRIVEAPVRWRHRPGSKVRLLRDGLSMLADIIRVRSRHTRLAESPSDET